MVGSGGHVRLTRARTDGGVRRWVSACWSDGGGSRSGRRLLPDARLVRAAAVAQDKLDV